MTLNISKLSVIVLLVLFFFMLLSAVGVLPAPFVVYLIWLGIGLLLLITGN